MKIYTEVFDPSSASSWGDWFIKLSLLFFMGGFIGWVIEIFFRRIVHGKWVNPGFLTGPLLPIYGFGNVAMYVLCSLPFDWVGPTWAQHLVLILFITVLMTVIEFIAGLIFIKGLKVKLWDYSTRWGNIMGIICPLFTVIWGVCGAGYFYLLYEPLAIFANFAVSNTLPISFVTGLFFGMLIVDLFYSLHVATRIKKYVNDKNLVVEWENMKSSFREFQKKTQAKLHFVFPFAGDTEQRKAQMDDYLADLKKRAEETKAKIQAKLEQKKNKKNVDKN